MPRSPCTFKKSDFTRAAKAARDAGLEIASFEITKDGVRFAVVPGKPQEVVRPETEGNEWDSAV
jgi:hypothetical protein